MTVRMRGIKRYRHPKTGIEYCYHRATKTRIKAPFGTPEFIEEVRTLDANHAVAKAIPGSLGVLVDEFRKSPDWTVIKPATRTSYDRVFDVLNCPLPKSAV
ncbi:hypothetical protein M2323_002610 [Rhodoblastus acidophilus]|uniref:hypothetical protein n=1 Tax=Rhodoblastus acidophilus TaxID=1074 RepID=UPI0022248ACB|nr:hypothetical protein [Rhodoblastus acidophilus]MCW2284723.1 hypothetical protein [Rhodoblastus acidophilus]MCW2333676.1 hypothetical protein [Rhodoblastus acidophilus]